MTPGQVTITCAACGSPRVVWKSWAGARRHFCSTECYATFRKFMQPAGEHQRIPVPKEEGKKVRRERKLMRRHLQAHSLMVAVVNCSDRMEAIEIAELTGALVNDVECMIRAYESMGRYHVNWAEVMIRRYWVAKLSTTKTDRSTTAWIQRFYRNNTKVSECLSKPTLNTTIEDRREMNDYKYRVDDRDRYQIEKRKPRRPWQTAIKFPVHAAA